MKCSEVYKDVPKDVWQTIVQAGKIQQEMVYTARNSVWPIDGGILEDVENDVGRMLLTG